MTSREFKDRVKRRFRKADVQATDDQLSALEEYVRLLARWNEKINLTGLDVANLGDEAVDRLLVEPLVAAKYLPPGPVHAIDVGSGSGSPAIPLLIARPGLTMTMVESKTRKAVFLTEVVRALGRPASVETARFEALLTRRELHEAAQLVTVRAVRLETRTLLTLQAFLAAGGQLFCFRATSAAEPTAIPFPLRLAAMHPLVESTRSQLVVLAKDQVAVRQP